MFTVLLLLVIGTIFGIFSKNKKISYAWTPFLFLAASYLYVDCSNNRGFCSLLYDPASGAGSGDVLVIAVLAVMYVVTVVFSIHGWFYFSNNKDWIHFVISLVPIIPFIVFAFRWAFYL